MLFSRLEQHTRKALIDRLNQKKASDRSAARVVMLGQTSGGCSFSLLSSSRSTDDWPWRKSTRSPFRWDLLPA